MEEKVLMYNSTGLTLSQNLKPASSNQRVIHAIEDILARHKGKKSERTIVGYCMIALRGLVKDETSDKILTAAFRNDYFPNDNIDKFSASVYRVLRSYSNKDSKTVHNPDEQWGDQKEAILQEAKTQIRKATSRIYSNHSPSRILPINGVSWQYGYTGFLSLYLPMYLITTLNYNPNQIFIQKEFQTIQTSIQTIA
jgi:hypothetical protein